MRRWSWREEWIRMSFRSDQSKIIWPNLKSKMSNTRVGTYWKKVFNRKYSGTGIIYKYEVQVHTQQVDKGHHV